MQQITNCLISATAASWSDLAASCSIGPAPRRRASQESLPELWAQATARFPRPAHGRWLVGAEPQDSGCPPNGISCTTATASFRLQLEALPSGQVGVFPEQRENWDWIARQVTRKRKSAERRTACSVLNLFAYTGGSTLAAAAAGAEVVHIDAAHNIVDRARQNAELSGLADRPIRWIPEDAMKFCQREVKRGNQYDAVILDPPRYGHGPKGEPWKINEHLLPLLELCGELTADSRAFVLVTCHSPGIGPGELSAYLAEGSSATAASRRRRASCFSKRPTAGDCRAACMRGGRQ